MIQREKGKHNQFTDFDFFDFDVLVGINRKIMHFIPIMQKTE
jgi:hypothetical protein